MNCEESPKYCRCTSSSIAHVKGCWEGWGNEVITDKPIMAEEASYTEGFAEARERAKLIAEEHYQHRTSPGYEISILTPQRRRTRMRDIDITVKGLVNGLDKRIDEVLAERDALRKRVEELQKYVAHDRDCILSFWEAGEPTFDGGYRTRYKGKWYQTKPVDETPKCECGLDEALQSGEDWRFTVKKVMDKEGESL